MTHLVLMAVLLAKFAAAQTPPVSSVTIMAPAAPVAVQILVNGLPAGCVWTAASAADVITITVGNCSAPPPVFSITTPVSLPIGTAGTAYSFNLASLAKPTGGVPPYTFSAAASFPAWLTLSPSGLLSGTPPAAGTYTISFTVTDSSKGGTSGTSTFIDSPATTFIVSR
jgi:hypothetical protein